MLGRTIANTTRSFPASFFDVGGYELHGIADIKSLALLAIVRLAKRNDVPTIVSRTIFLDVGAHLWFLNTLFFWAIARK